MSKFNDLINGDQPVLVDFFATWCGPCKAMSPILQEVSTIIGNSGRILKIDIDKNQSVAEKYQVRSVPTLILFQKGQIIWRHSGLLSANELSKKIKEY